MLRLEEEEMACQARAEAAMTEAMLLEQDEARRRQESLRLGKERQHQRLWAAPRKALNRLHRGFGRCIEMGRGTAPIHTRYGGQLRSSGS